MRAIWKGHIRFSLVTIPIRIYNAIETSSSISFRQLHRDDNGPVGYDKKCKKCGNSLKNDEIVKGYEYEPDQYAIVEKEDIDKIKLKSTKVIEIEGFVDAVDVHSTLYDAPYFAGPDGDVAAKSYALLRETLRKTGKMGIGKVVLRDRESVMLMAAQGPGLLLYKLRYPKEVRKIENVPQLDGLEVDETQLQLAETLVNSMSKSMKDIELVDRYKDAMIEMIQNKIEGKEVVTLAEEDVPVVDIMTALKESIDQAKKTKKPMKKATGKGKTQKDTSESKSSSKTRKAKSA